MKPEDKTAVTLDGIDPGPDALSISARVNSFASLLRYHGFLLSLHETAKAIQALDHIDILNENEVRWVLRCIFASHQRDWKNFNELYDAFWHGYTKIETRISSLGQTKSSPNSQDVIFSKEGHNPLANHVKRMEEAEADNDNSSESGDKSKQQTASRQETLAKADFSNIVDPDQSQELNELAENLSRKIRYRQLRRKRLHRKGASLDIRKTLQRSVSTGGLPLRLYRKRPRRKPFKLVVFLDVSGSMDNYSRFFLRFIHGLLGAFRDADAFIFHTRLIQISSLLKERNPIKLMERMALIAQGWSGGTRIGESLANFNKEYARSVLTSRTLVMIVSDGYDTGTTDQLDCEMMRLRRKAKRIVWLNPLLGSKDYKPTCAAMAVALPYVDLFAPAHNLESLAALEPEFARI